LRKRRTEDWLKLIPIIISTGAIMVSIATAIATSQFSQQKDFLLNRSWLSASELISPLHRDSQAPVSENIAVRVTNNGRAPALHAIVIGSLLPADSGQSSVRSDIAAACSKASEVSGNGDFVPPGSSLTIQLNAPIRNEPKELLSGDSSSHLVIVGCIGYDDSLDHKRHVTSFGFRSAQKPTGEAHSGTAASQRNVSNKYDGEIQLVWTPYSLGYGIAY
jgi:hypothetical protein